MTDYSIDTKSMTSKAISLIVAIVVFACVLIPVLDAIVSGDSGSGESSNFTTYTNTGTPLALVDPNDSAEHTMIVEIVNDSVYITVDEGVPYNTEITTDVFNEGDKNLFLLMVSKSGKCIWIDDNGWVSYHELADRGDYFEPIYATIGSLLDNPITLTYQNNICSFVDENDESYSISIDLVFSPTKIDYVSTSEQSLILADSLIYWTNPAVFVSEQQGVQYWVNGSFAVSTFDMLEYGATIIYNSIEYSCQTELNLEITDNGEYYTFDGISMTIIQDVTETVPASIIENGLDYYGNYYVAVPYQITVESSGSGSDSDNSVVSTLIGIIPIFVALGLTLAIVGMFYNSKMD